MLGGSRLPKKSHVAPASNAGLHAPLLTAGLLMLVFVTIPPPPMSLNIDVDSSLSGVLNYAHQHRLQYGTDVVFTYGPMGFLTFFFYSPHAVGLRMAADVALCSAVAAGICLLAWRLRIFWRCLLLCVFAWVAANAWPRTDWVINSGLLCWGLLCFVESGRRLAFSVVAFVALGVFAALAKTSFLVVAGTSTILVAADLLTRGRRRLALVALVGFGGGFFSGWVIAGQSPMHLGSYLVNSLAVIQGYNQALGWEGSEIVRKSGWPLAVMMPLLVLLRTLTAFEGQDRRTRWRRIWLSCWVCFFAYTIWKHGWVRVDGFHVIMFLGFMPVFALALEVLAGRHRLAGLVARGLVLACCCSAIVSLHRLFFPSVSRALIAPLRSMDEHARCLLQPGDYVKRMNEVLAIHRREAQLPRLREILGDATVDVFGQNPGYALFNEMNYRPRPVFQSYAACNASLMSLNEQFYRSRAAPEFVLFSLVGMDRKLTILEDAWLLRHLLINYTPVASEGRFLLLNARSTEAPRLTLLHEGTIAPGRRLDLKPFGDLDLWMEVNLAPTLSGRLRQFLYRPPIVKLAAWRESGGSWIMRQRAPASMLAAGFLASPLLLRNDDVLNLYANTNLTRPAAYSIELPPEENHFWQNIARFRIYRIENRLGRCISAESAAQFRVSGFREPGDDGSSSPGRR